MTYRSEYGIGMKFAAAIVLLCASVLHAQEFTKTDCNKGKACYSEPASCTSSSDCKYLLKYQANDVDVRFELSAKDRWVAVGFNSIRKMPGVDVLLCRTYRDNRVEAGSYYSKDHERPRKNKKDSLSVNLLSSEYKDGVISCKLSRPIKPRGTDMSDLTQKWYLLFALGPVARNRIQIHTWKAASSEKTNISAATSTPIAPAKISKPLVKAHGMLMVIAWLGLASMGVYMARYRRNIRDIAVEFQDDTWFKVHRVLMLMAAGTTVVAILLIFAHTNWTWVKSAGAHPVLGIIVLILALLQPLMALIRPDPKDDKRWIFNWVHRTVGLITLLSAFVNIILGMFLPTAGLLLWGAVTVAGIYAFVLCVFVFGELYAYIWRCTTSYQSVKSSLEMKEVAQSSDPLTKPSSASDSAVPCFAPEGWMCALIMVLAVIQIMFLILIVTSKYCKCYV